MELLGVTPYDFDRFISSFDGSDCTLSTSRCDLPEVTGAFPTNHHFEADSWVPYGTLHFWTGDDSLGLSRDGSSNISNVLIQYTQHQSLHRYETRINSINH